MPSGISTPSATGGLAAGSVGLVSGGSTAASTLRATSAANEAAAASAAFMGLPIVLSPKTLVPWGKLPIDPHASVRWQCFRQRTAPTASDASANANASEDTQPFSDASSATQSASSIFQAALAGIRQLTVDEAVKYAAAQCGSGKDPVHSASTDASAASLALTLANAQLWASNQGLMPDSSSAESKAPSLWLFEINMPSSSTLEEGTELRAADRQATNQIIEQLKASKDAVLSTEGSFTLSDAYLQKKGEQDAVHDSALLLPKQEIREPLRYLMLALEDFFTRRWIWLRERLCEPEALHTDAHIADVSNNDQDTERRTAKAEVQPLIQMEGEDEEEGALKSKAQTHLQPMGKDAGTEPFDIRNHWPQSRGVLQRRARRLGRGITLSVPMRSTNSYLDIGMSRPPPPLQGRVQCFANDEGHIILQAFFRETGYIPCELTDADIDIVLAPLCMPAHLRHIRRLPSQQMAPSLPKTDVEQATERLDKARLEFLKKLELHDVPTGDSVQHWALCTQSDGRDLLWPVQCCFKACALGGYISTQLDTSPVLKFTGAQSTSEDALNLVREAVGVKIEKEASDEDEASDDESADESAKEDTTIVKEEVKPEDQETTAQDVETFALPKLNATGQNEAVDTLKTRNTGIQGMAPTDGSVVAARRPSLVRPSSAGKNAAQIDATSRRPSRAHEDDLDLWGSFGFSNPDEVPIPSQGMSRDGLEDGGFGLITEDDFSFFDDAAVPFSGFDTPGIPMIPEESVQGEPAESNDVVMQHVDTVPGNLDLPITRQASQDDGDSNGHSGQSISQATFTDPPSLPGFTPGSFSTNSPTGGGLNSKTPRTPYSPNQDLVDSNVRIVGEHVGQYNDGAVSSDEGARDYLSQPVDSQFSPNEAMPPDQQGDHIHNGEDGGDARRFWLLRHRRGIKTKYEDGKYAMPSTSVQRFRPRSKVDEEGMARSRQQQVGGRSTAAYARHRLAQRALGPTRTRGNVGVGNMALLQKARINALRIDDAMSEMTEDETMSDWSSRYDQESDGDASTADSEGESIEIGEADVCSDLLKAAVSVLEKGHVGPETTHYTFSNATLPAQSSLDPTHRLADDQINSVLTHLVDNIHMRRQASKFCKAEREGALVRATDVQQLFGPCAGLEAGALSVHAMIAPSVQQGSEKVRGHAYLMEPPHIAVGYQDNVVSMTPVALPLWNKLKLQAVNGPKHVVAFGLYSGKLATSRQSALREWFDKLSETFLDNALGNHSLAQDGLLDLGRTRQRSISQSLNHMMNDDEQWSDTLASLLSRFSGDLLDHKNVVLYAISNENDAIIQQSWPIARLERDLRQLAVQRHGAIPQLITVRYITYDVICSPHMAYDDPACGTARFAAALYDSLPLATLPSYNAEEHLPVYKAEAVSACAPSFTVLPSPVRVLTAPQQFELNWTTQSLNILAQGSFIHFGYHIASRDGGISVVAMMDERGNEHGICGWTRKPDASLDHELSRVWAFIVGQVQRVRVVWRVVICKDRPMSDLEADSWSRRLENWRESGPAPLSSHILDITIACVDKNAPIVFAAERERTDGALPKGPHLAAVSSAEHKLGTSAAASKAPESLFIDPARAQYVLMPSSRIAVSTSSSESSTTILPLQSAALVTIPQSWTGAASTRSERLDAFGTDNSHQSKVVDRGASESSTLWVHVLQVHCRASHTESVKESTAASSGASQARTDSLSSRLLHIIHQFQALELVARERALLNMESASRNLPWHLATLAALEAGVLPVLASC